MDSPIGAVSKLDLNAGQLHIPEPPPEDFDPWTASNDVLISHGLPPRPDKATFPQQHAQWERLMAQPLTFIRPEFEIIKGSPVPSSLEADLTSSKAGGEASTSRKWSGAVNSELASGDEFKSITASWTIPIPYPPNCQWTGSGWKEGAQKYICGSWVGIGGVGKNKNLWQAGTAQQVSIDGGEITEQTSYAWFEWWPGQDYQKINNFNVKFGDLITCTISFHIFRPQSLRVPINVAIPIGQVTIINHSSHAYTAFSQADPNSTKNKFVGKTAEWIIEAHLSSGKSTMPYIGASFMYDCSAATKGGAEKNLKDADLVYLVDGNDKTLVSAEKENDAVLGFFNGDRPGISPAATCGAVQPTEIYDGGFGLKASRVLLRIGNGGAGQSGLVKALADAFIVYSVNGGSAPFLVAWYESDTTVSIEYLKSDTVDVGITYSEIAEQIAIKEGIATAPSYYAFRDHFMIVGPTSDPAEISGITDVLAMFSQLHATAEAAKSNIELPVRFLSRYDKSATNIKESALWLGIGQVPWATAYSTWYHQYIAFPIQALTAAILLKEYTLTDRGTYLSLPDGLPSQTTIYKTATDDENDPLLNPAHLLIGKHATNAKTAKEFADWLVSDNGQKVIKDFKKNGEQLYSPAP